MQGRWRLKNAYIIIERALICSIGAIIVRIVKNNL